MKEDVMRKAIGEIDDSLIEGAGRTSEKNKAKPSWVKWVPVAAAITVVTVAAALTLPALIKNETPVETTDVPSVSETGEKSGEGFGDPNYTGKEIGLYEKYVYSVDSGKFAPYVQGRVINEKYVGEKIDDVTVTAGWVRSEELPQAEKEHARAEIYEIIGVSADTAVAIKFLDKLEAETTDFYYVIMNPNADLTPVQPYVITFDDPAQYDGLE
ncbi:MAG: hypothetical protein J5585_09030 [Clostridia bacterium]|nr:hypothetical protein [Clostridia bacterium]